MHRFALASALLFAAACSSTTTPRTSPSPDTETGTETPAEETPAEENEPPTAFTDAEVQDLFDGKCVRCHAGATTVLDLRSFKSTTIDVPASTSASGECSESATPTRIVPGDRNASLLWRKVKGTQDCGDAMPPPGKGVKLTAAELERLGLYIDALLPE